MRVTTAKKYYNGPANIDNNGIVIDTSKYLIDIYLTRSFKFSTAYVPADEFSGKSYIAWLGWLRIEVSGRMEMEA